jgi:membrane protease YdiL (CAAX protease family)
LAAAPLWVGILLLAIVPGIAEEFLFRGFLLSGLAGKMRKWSAIVAAAAIFGVYHFVIDKIPVTALLGVVLGYLCWQSRSLLPGILFHIMHNGLSLVISRFPSLTERLGLGPDSEAVNTHLPLRILLPAAAMFVIALMIVATLGNGKQSINYNRHR